MRRALFAAMACVVAIGATAAEEKKAITKQAERGRELFLKSPKGTACATCHSMAGLGTAVGPDLSKMASVVSAHGMVMTIKMTMTAYVQNVKTPTGTFPGLFKQKDGENVQIWDLSKLPPVLLTLASKDIDSMERDTKWQHPPTGTDYSSQELADIIGFLKWAANGSQKEIKVDDVE